MWQWRPFDDLVNIDCIIAKIGDHQRALSGEEQRAVMTAVPERMREFAAGRSLARMLLSHRDVHPKSIRVGDGGQPLWPVGICGSISHTTSHVGAAICATDDFRGVGIDIEFAGSAERLDPSLILTRAERDKKMAVSLDDFATQIFSCKEAVFKAVYPIVGESFEFTDIVVEVHNGEFFASAGNGIQSAPMISQGRGRMTRNGNLIASLFSIER